MNKGKLSKPPPALLLPKDKDVKSLVLFEEMVKILTLRPKLTDGLSQQSINSRQCETAGHTFLYS